MDYVESGTLFIVATPIGNLEDITPRAVRVLGEVDLIAAEDTRHSRGLLTHFNIKTPMVSCHKFNEGKRGGFLVDALLEGKSIALISDAGTPCISDPGHKIVAYAASAGVQIVPICGANAVATALSVCGFDATCFSFVGFLPKGKIDALLAAKTEVVAFFESPKRIAATLKLLRENLPEARLCLCNDISKKFERIYRGTPEEVLDELMQNPAAEKGEYTCVVRLAPDSSSDSAPSVSITPEAQLVEILIANSVDGNGANLKEASRILLENNSGFTKKEIYSAMLRLKNLLAELEQQ